MNKIQTEINTAFQLISSILVSEDNVERMATAKHHLREAFKMAATAETPAEVKADQKAEKPAEKKEESGNG